VLAAVLLAGCGGGGTTTGGTSSPALTSSAGGGGGGGGEGLTSGTAHVEISGATSRTLDLTLDLGFTNWFPQGMNLVWTQGDEHLTISGTSAPGSHATGGTGAEAMSLNMAIVTDQGLHPFESGAGECTVDLTASSAGEVAGTFQCSGLPSTVSTETIDASGSFSAT